MPPLFDYPRLSSYHTFFISSYFSYFFFKIPTLSYLFWLAACCFKIPWITVKVCASFDCKGQYFSMIFHFGAQYDILL